MGDLVIREDRDGLARLILNRPDVLNALSPALFVELRAQIDAIAAATDSIGCVLLSGAGRSFCAGNDLGAIESGEQAPTPSFQVDTVDALERLPQPTLCAVQGHCYTGGLELALACDLLIAADSARFADTHGKWALVPGWGMSQRLPRRIGPLKAKEMMFTGRPVGGGDAVAIGLANACVPDDDLMASAEAMARDILANSWHTLRGDKMLLNDGQNYGLGDGLAFERAASPGRGPDFRERIAAFRK